MITATCGGPTRPPGRGAAAPRSSSRRTPGYLPLVSPEDIENIEDIEDLDGWTLHRLPLRLRHSALTHDAEDRNSPPMPLARSRHASVRSLERYARPGVDPVAQHVAARDPAARRRT
ncbi:hypothetical protein ACIP88_25385 [Streptomyces uncialis]|uniref:hypothetical protein n=1 Tax=Streptomyces uncialis TaxID=1048205 RepID=UPI0037FA0A3A